MTKSAAQSRLAQAIKAKEFVVTAEITPPVSGNAQDLIDKASVMKGVVDAVNVTDGAGARAHMSNVVSAGLLAGYGIEPILQFTCRDRNRIALQSDLMGAGALGVANVLMLGGDDPSQGDQPDAKPVFDLDTGALIQTARQMRDEAVLPSGRKVASPPQLFIGAADIPVDPKPDWSPSRLADKADKGAAFIQTQYCFDMEIMARYIGALRDSGLTERLAMLIGTGPIASAKSARWMRDNLFGVIIPDHLIERLEKAGDEKAEGRKICIEIIEQLREMKGVAGTHIMAIRQEDSVPEILEAARAGPRYRKAA